jgi:hypothetical protein
MDEQESGPVGNRAIRNERIAQGGDETVLIEINRTFTPPLLNH